MTRLLLSAFILLSFWSGPARATNITVQSGRDSSEDRIQVLRGQAEILLKETQQRVTLSEGEELVVRPGGKTERTELDVTAEQKKWQAELTRMGDGIQLNELPSLIQGLRQSQGDTFKALQDQFKSLSAAGSASSDDQHAFLKNIERLTGTLLADQTILSSLQLKVQTAMATASPAQQAQLAGYAKMISDSRSALQSYMAESSKMAKTTFAAPPAADPKIVETAKAEVADTWATVDGIIREVQGNPAGLSQDFFLEGQEKLNDSLNVLGDLKLRLQAELDKDPSNAQLLGLLRQISGYSSQAAGMLKDLAVVRVDHSALTEIQQLNETMGNDVAYLVKTVADMQAAGLTVEQLNALFLRYDEMAAQYAAGQKLYETLTRSAAGQKYKTAEQQELETLWAGVAETFQKLGTAGESLASPDRDQLWMAYLKRKQEDEAMAFTAPQLALSNDITAGTLQGQPIVAKYLPITPPAAHSDVRAALSGKLLGDVIVKDGITFGVMVSDAGPTTRTGAVDAASIKQAALEVFRIENGQYTSTVVEVVDIYSGGPHAALGLGANNALMVFINDTQGEKVMVGELYTLNRDTLLSLAPSSQLSFGRDQGWYPYIDEEGNVRNLSIDAPGVFSKCANGGPCVAPVTELDVILGADAVKAAHSNFTFNTAATPEELPTDVVAKRLTGETGVTGLGNYDYMSWGKWNDGAGVTDTIYTNSSWIAGDLTPAIDIPTTGSASYTGQVVGKLKDGGGISNIGGTTALTANFSGKKLTGTFDMTKNNAVWKRANVDAQWGAGNIAGTLTATDATMSGAVNGNFFGPAANSVGGAWNLANTAGTDKAAGVFTGDKQ